MNVFQTNERFSLLAGSYKLGSVYGIDITCHKLDLYLQDVTSTSVGVLPAVYQDVASFYNRLKTACRSRDAALAFGVIAWYASQIRG